MSLAAARSTAQERVQDVKLVSLFLSYLTEKDEVTAAEALEFKRFQEILDGVTFSDPAWDYGSEEIAPNNRLFCPDYRPIQQDTSNCPGSCCCGAGVDSCLTWYPILAFI